MPALPIDLYQFQIDKLVWDSVQSMHTKTIAEPILSQTGQSDELPGLYEYMTEEMY